MRKLFGLLAILAGSSANAAESPTYFPSDVPNAPFSESVELNGILYLSGELGNIPGTATLAPGGLAGQAKQTMENIGATLKKHGLTYDDLFKCTVMLADMSQWAEFNKIYVGYFKPNRLPSRSAFGANGLALGAALEVECWARAGKK